MAGWIGVDLDATLATYGEWRGEDHIGDPILPMVARIKKWLSQGVEVRIFTARAYALVEAERTGNATQVQGVKNNVIAPIERWCEQHIGVALPVTCMKDYGMVELWDDRAVQVVPNTGTPFDLSRS